MKALQETGAEAMEVECMINVLLEKYDMDSYELIRWYVFSRYHGWETWDKQMS